MSLRQEILLDLEASYLFKKIFSFSRGSKLGNEKSVGSGLVLLVRTSGVAKKSRGQIQHSLL